MMETTLISVVVCTYNRSEMLKGCLESLRLQTVDKSNYEVIVVDNNSSDDTRQVVDEFLDQVNLRYFLETAQGLSHARNRGYQEAAGEYVAYIDDDTRAAPDWLEVANNIFDSIQSELHCLGGPYHPFYTSPKPDWFKDDYEVRGFGGTPRYLENGQYLSGANMIWLKDTLKGIGGFDINVGVIGNQLRMGEETSAFQKLKALQEGAGQYFSPDTIIYHWVPEYKMTVRYQLKRRFAMGQYAAYQMESENVGIKLRVIGQLALKIMKTEFRSLPKYKSYPHWQNWVVEELACIATYTGKLLWLVGIKPKLSQSS